MDLRAKRSFHKINKCFKELMAEIGFQKLSVSDIAEKADMNRSTFYSHFKDKYDLYEYHLNEIMDLFSFYSIYYNFTHPISSYPEAELKEMRDKLSKVMAKLFDEKEFVLAMMEVLNNHELTQRYIDYLGAEYGDYEKNIVFKFSTVEVPSTLLMSFGVSMFTTVIKWWFLTKPELKADEIANILLNTIGYVPTLIKQPVFE